MKCYKSHPWLKSTWIWVEWTPPWWTRVWCSTQMCPLEVNKRPLTLYSLLHWMVATFWHWKLEMGHGILHGWRLLKELVRNETSNWFCLHICRSDSPFTLLSKIIHWSSCCWQTGVWSRWYSTSRPINEKGN